MSAAKSKLRALQKLAAKKLPPPPPREIRAAEFVWLTARLLNRARERREAAPAELKQLEERHRREDEELRRTHPHLASGPGEHPGDASVDEALAGIREFLARRAEREVVPEQLDLSAEDRAALLEAVRQLDAELSLPPLPGRPIAFTDDELCPFLAPEVYLRVVAAQAKLRGGAVEISDAYGRGAAHNPAGGHATVENPGIQAVVGPALVPSQAHHRSKSSASVTSVVVHSALQSLHW
jgi:hypothetical protein